MKCQKSYITNKHKTVGGNLDVFLAPQKDKNRVYVTNSETEVAIVEDVAPMAFLDSDIKDRHKYAKPQTATFIKLNEDSVLFLFCSKNDGLQRRFQIPFSRVKQFTFKSLEEGFQQDGLQVVPKDLTGKEFEVSSFGEVSGEKRKGVSSSIWCFDQTNRGRQGEQGLRGIKGEAGREFKIRNATPHEHEMYAKSQGKRIPTSQKELHQAMDGDQSYYVPFSKAFFDEIKRNEKESSYE